MRSKSFILGKCSCGCNSDIPIIYRQGGSKIGQIRRWVQNHGNRKGVSQNQGPKNGQWKGDKVNKGVTLHCWVRRHLPKPELCEYCNKVEPYDLANTTGKYERGFENWKYLCRRCHMLSDGRMNNLKQYSGNIIIEDK